jgi:hypothetical protein
LSDVITCKNCGVSITGNYCSNCGEKKYSEHDKSMHHLLHEAVHFLTHFDGSFFKTLKLFFTRPGQVSADYVAGIRKKYFKPVSLYLLFVVAYLLFPFFSGLNMKFNSYVSNTSEFHRLIIPAAKQKAVQKNISLIALGEIYDTKSVKVSKIFLLLYLPLSAILLFGLFFNKRKYFFDHFILSAELNSFLVAFGFLLFPAIIILTNWLGKLFNKDFHFTLGELSTSIIAGGIFLLAIFFAFKKFYKQNWLWTVIKSLLFLAVFAFIINPIYRITLFFTTLLFI